MQCVTSIEILQQLLLFLFSRYCIHARLFLAWLPRNVKLRQTHEKGKTCTHKFTRFQFTCSLVIMFFFFFSFFRCQQPIVLCFHCDISISTMENLFAKFASNLNSTRIAYQQKQHFFDYKWQDAPAVKYHSSNITIMFLFFSNFVWTLVLWTCHCRRIFQPR